jgi:PDZ domain-containing protein
MARQVVDAPPGASPPRRPMPLRRRIWRAIGIGVAAALGALVVGANFVRVPYVITSPGDARPLGSVVHVEGAPTYDHDDDLRYLTVRVSNQDPSLWRYLFAQFDGDVSIDRRERVIGCATYDENARLNDLLMNDSQTAAKTVALRRLGHQVVDLGQRAVIVSVECDGPSRGRLMLGDVITAIDGTAVSSNETIGPLVQAHRPGDRIRVTVDRGGQARDVDVTLGDRQGAGFLGIVTQNLVDEQLPFEVDIDTRHVSGPSAGLAFTLAIIDVLTPGDLTGDRRVAVTGSMYADGSVGAVGGIEQKTITARERGVSLMLVPKGEARDARAHAGNMRVVAVATIEDALEALERYGGDGTPPVSGTGAGDGQ